MSCADRLVSGRQDGHDDVVGVHARLGAGLQSTGGGGRCCRTSSRTACPGRAFRNAPKSLDVGPAGFPFARPASRGPAPRPCGYGRRRSRRLAGGRGRSGTRAAGCSTGSPPPSAASGTGRSSGRTRDGVQDGDEMKAWENSTPSRASRSKVGVFTTGSPYRAGMRVTPVIGNRQEDVGPVGRPRHRETARSRHEGEQGRQCESHGQSHYGWWILGAGSGHRFDLQRRGVRPDRARAWKPTGYHGEPLK